MANAKTKLQQQFVRDSLLAPEGILTRHPALLSYDKIEHYIGITRSHIHRPSMC